jgi:hypothetical protein
MQGPRYLNDREGSATDRRRVLAWFGTSDRLKRARRTSRIFYNYIELKYLQEVKLSLQITSSPAEAEPCQRYEVDPGV